MIRAIIGKKGAGKSKLAVLMLIKELRETSRGIATNLALEFQPWVDGAGVARAGLLRILQDRFGTTFDAERRIYMLRDDEVRRFFAVRLRVPQGEGERVVLRVKSAGDSGVTQSEHRFKFDVGMVPMAYFIDEAHEHFPARSWAELGPETLGWASQSRRCGDDCWLLTQVSGLMAKPLRDQVDECFGVANHAHMRWLKVRQPDIITYSVYNRIPQSDSELTVDNDVLRYSRFGVSRHDVESCYNTSKGVGVLVDTKADMGYHAPGIPVWSAAAGLVVGCALTGVLVWGVFKGLTKGGGMVVSSVLRNDKMVSATNGPAVHGSLMGLPGGGYGSPLDVTEHGVERRADARRGAAVDVERWGRYTGVGSCAAGGSETFVLTTDTGRVFGRKLERVAGGVLLDGHLYSPVVALGKF